MTVRKKRWGAVIALAMVCTAFLTACNRDSAEQAATAKPVIGVLLYREGDLYIDMVAESIRQSLSDVAELDMIHSGDDQLVQNEQLDAMLKKKVSAVAVNIVDHQAAGQVVDAIKKAGVPVIFFNREPDLDTIKAYDKACFVGTDVFDAGIMQGDIIKELWSRHPEYDRNGDGKCQYIMLQANLDNPEAVARTEYSIRQAREGGVDMQQMGETLLCNWDENNAREAVLAAFPLIGDSLEFIVANNDAMALGALAALQEFGYNLENGTPGRFIPVVGVDAIPRATEAIQKRVMSGTVVQDAEGMGKAVAVMALNAAAGKDFLEGLSYGWDDSGVAIRIPYSRYTNE